MKIIVTGSLGHISKPLTKTLLNSGHEVTVISSSPERRNEIESLGAKPAIGSLEDTSFLVQTFTGADAVYSMVPPNNYFDPDLDLLAYYRRVGLSYYNAVKQSGIKRIVNLSSIGANMEKGNGILLGAHDIEHMLNELPAEVSITHLRPTSFYYNLFSFADMIKNTGVIAANYGGDDVVPWVSPLDIAAVAANELETLNEGRKIRYVVSEALSCNRTAEILGQEIKMPDLKWIVISDEEMLNGLKAIGMNPTISAGLVEMYAGFRSGILVEHFNQYKPAEFGLVKMTDFAKDFANVYLQK